jgi:serine/threonine-protein kinase
MAEVWEAESADGSQRVAIKRILPRFADDPSVRRMFMDEARIVSVLDHPSIVKLVDSGWSHGSDFLVFEFVDGADAKTAFGAARRSHVATSDSVTLYVVAEIARALHYAHGLRDAGGHPLGIVHRDVTPSNLMLSWRGEVKLADFGIARAALRDERTSTGVIKGKEGYFPPERDATPASDIYSLGATLHALAAGKPPLTTTIEMGQRFAGGRLPIDRSISPPLAKLVEACMDLEPRNRPSAADLHAAASRLAGADPARDLRSWLEVLKPIVAPVGLLDSLLQPALLAHVPAPSGPGRASRFDE